MKITTWNINGVRARIEGAVAYVREAKPDVLCFQEIKCQDEGFPTEAFTELGYSVATHGQKGFNGVALLSLHPLEAAPQRGKLFWQSLNDSFAIFMERRKKYGKHTDNAVRFPHEDLSGLYLKCTRLIRMIETGGVIDDDTLLDTANYCHLIRSRTEG